MRGGGLSQQKEVVARGLRDAGMEVIYTGLWQSPEAVARAVEEEDADVLGVSILSGAHMTLFPAILDEMKKRKAGDIILFGGGIIPDDEKAELERQGVAKIFTPGAPTPRGTSNATARCLCFTRSNQITGSPVTTRMVLSHREWGGDHRTLA